MFDTTVPVVEVNRLNLDRLWCFLQTSVKRADFIAVDLELSGLGNYTQLKDKPFQERFDRIVESVKTRSILSIGLALFYLDEKPKKPEEGGENAVNLTCRVFNILTMAARPFTVEPGALKFLNKHNFDFNKLIETGIPYELKNIESPMCQLWETVLTSGASVIFHNGFLDLAFIYHHLFCEIPQSVNTFQSAICDWFGNAEVVTEEDKQKVGGRGLFFDNKFIASTEQQNATYLEYVFRKNQRENVVMKSKKQPHLDVKFLIKAGRNELTDEDVDMIDCSMSAQFMRNDFSIKKETRDSVCVQYSAYGCCKEIGCKKAHEVDLVLDLESYNVQSKKARTNGNAAKSEAGDMETDCLPYEPSEFSSTGCHRAGMDAFMTGFSVLYSLRKQVLKNGKFDAEMANKTLVPGMEKPLPIVRSSYATMSDRHLELWDFLGRKKAESIRMKSNIN